MKNFFRANFVCLLLAALPAVAQPAASSNSTPTAAASSSTNHLFTFAQVQAAREHCIASRRKICGRIVNILPGGLIVDSGYTSLMRPALSDSWLIPGTADATKEPNIVEKNVPGCPCAGLIYLTDFPKSRRGAPKQYDYVVLEAFPAGEFAYTSVGAIQKTVRHFTCSLPLSVRFNLASNTNSIER